MPRSRSALPSLCASAALLAGTLAVVATPAHADPGAQCADTFPASELQEGQAVTGLTTAGVHPRGGASSSRTEPEAFTGTYLDTLRSDDGDLLVFDLKGSRITKADGTIDAGVWSGMSGSPVYVETEDGRRLVGAVSYTFGGQQGSSIAGVTPAADMRALLVHGDDTGTPERITLSSRQKKQLVASGASSKELGNGARRIAPISAITLPEKLSAGYERIATLAGAPQRTLAGGGSTSRDDATPTPIVAGGNLAVADSYGSLASYGLGTATLVCDGKVVGFGHPMDFLNASRTLHNATTSFIQEDGAGSYKLGNLENTPQGVLEHDGLAGVMGVLGETLAATTITSTASFDGGPAKTYRSSVPNPDALAEIAATHAFRDAALVEDQLGGGGEALVSYTIKGVSKNRPIELKRTQRYSATEWLSEYVGNDIASDIHTLQQNDFAQVDVSDVTIDDVVLPDYKALKVGKVEIKYAGTKKFVTLKNERTLTLKKGRTATLRITLVPTNRFSKATPKVFEREVRPYSSATGYGRIVISGQNTQRYWDEEWEEFGDSYEDYYWEDDDELTATPREPRSASEVAAQIAAQPRNDEVVVSHDFRARTSKKSRATKVVNSDSRYTKAGSVVSGTFYFPVRYR
jgi:hypothetical protein